MKTTVIMRTKNSGDILAQTLKALFSQDYNNFELFIVDSGSKDDTLEIASFYKHRLLKIKAKDYQPAKVLNDAICRSESENIVFLNSDTVMLKNNTLSTLLKELEKNDAVYARQVARPEAKAWVKRDYEKAFPSGDAPEWMYFSLPLAAMKKSAWQKLPFYMDSWASEDTKWGVEARKLGMSVKYVPNALVMHSHNYTFKQLFNRRFVEGEADVFIFDNSFKKFDMSISFIKSVINDLRYSIKNIEFDDFFINIPRRFVYHLAYFLGHEKGLLRQKKSIKEVSFKDYQ